MRDLFNNLSVVQALAPQTATTSKTSSAIDLQGFDSALVLFAVGQSGDTLSGSAYWTLSLQHSDTEGSGYEDVAASDILGGSTSVIIDDAAEDETAVSFGYVGSKRYLQAVAAATGTHASGTPLGIVGVRGHAALKPVAG